MSHVGRNGARPYVSDLVAPWSRTHAADVRLGVGQVLFGMPGWGLTATACARIATSARQVYTTLLAVLQTYRTDATVQQFGLDALQRFINLCTRPPCSRRTFAGEAHRGPWRCCGACDVGGGDPE